MNINLNKQQTPPLSNPNNLTDKELKSSGLFKINKPDDLKKKLKIKTPFSLINI